MQVLDADIPPASSPVEFPSSEELGSLQSPPGRGRGGFYTVHALVREFCKKQMEDEEGRRALLDGAEFYLNAAKAFKNESQAQVFFKLDARHLLFEAGEFERADDIVNGVQALLRRWGMSLAERLLRESVATLEGHSKAVAMHSIANICSQRGEYEKAFNLYQQVYQILEELGDKGNMAAVRHQLGMIHHDRGDYEAALREYEASLRIAEALGDQAGIASTRHQLGMIHQDRGDYEAALREYEASLRVFEKLGSKQEVAAVRHQLGVIHQQRGEYEAALQEYEASLRIREALGNKYGIALSKGQIARIHEERGEYAAAFAGYLYALTALTQLQSPDARIAVNNLRDLRNAWGAAAFDAAWQDATGEAVPEELKE